MNIIIGCVAEYTWIENILKEELSMKNAATCSINRQKCETEWKNWTPKRGEIFMVDLGSDNMDSEQQGVRPAVIISNDIGNRMSGIVTIAPLTTKNKVLPKIHVHIPKKYGLKFDSYALTERIRSVSKRRFFYNNRINKVGVLPEYKMEELRDAVMFELGLT